MSDNDTQGRTVNRRTVLKTVGASAVAGIATAGSATAKEAPMAQMERLETAYDDSIRAQWAVSQHADDVLAELARRGILARGDAAELDFDALSVKGLGKDGTPTAQLETTTERDGKSVEVVVRPGTGRAYATVRTDGDVYTVESVAGSDDVTTQNCYYNHKCESAACSSGGGCVYLEQQCCDYGTGYKCGNWEEDGCCTC